MVLTSYFKKGSVIKIENTIYKELCFFCAVHSQYIVDDKSLKNVKDLVSELQL